jgi:hypothetical protein
MIPPTHRIIYHLLLKCETDLDQLARYRTLVFSFVPGDGKKVQFSAVAMAQLA